MEESCLGMDILGHRLDTDHVNIIQSISNPGEICYVLFPCRTSFAGVNVQHEYGIVPARYISGALPYLQLRLAFTVIKGDFPWQSL